MKKLSILLVLFIIAVSSLGLAAARDTFTPDSLRGRYTGNLTISENFSDGTNTVHVEALQLLALTFDGKAEVAGVSSVTVAVPGQAPFTCAFQASGVYEIGDDGLGTAALDLAPVAAGCGDGGGGVKLKMSLLVGGHNRSRLDVTIDSAQSTPDGEQLPLVGSGLLTKL